MDGHEESLGKLQDLLNKARLFLREALDAYYSVPRVSEEISPLVVKAHHQCADAQRCTDIALIIENLKEAIHSLFEAYHDKDWEQFPGGYIGLHHPRDLIYEAGTIFVSVKRQYEIMSAA